MRGRGRQEGTPIKTESVLPVAWTLREGVHMRTQNGTTLSDSLEEGESRRPLRFGPQVIRD